MYICFFFYFNFKSHFYGKKMKPQTYRYFYMCPSKTTISLSALTFTFHLLFSEIWRKNNVCNIKNYDKNKKHLVITNCCNNKIPHKLFKSISINRFLSKCNFNFKRTYRNFISILNMFIDIFIKFSFDKFIAKTIIIDAFPPKI